MKWLVDILRLPRFLSLTKRAMSFACQQKGFKFLPAAFIPFPLDSFFGVFSGIILQYPSSCPEGRFTIKQLELLR